MKKFTYFVYGFFILWLQSAHSQVLLDTISITNEKKKVTSNVIPILEKKITPLRFYFFPNLDAYYDLKTSKYLFRQNGIWITSDRIAPNYRGYSIYNTYRVEINDYFEDKPFEYLVEHQRKFPSDYKGRIRKMEAAKKESLDKLLTKE